MVLSEKRGVLYIKKRSLQEWMVLIFFFMPFMLAFLTELLGLPSFIRHLMDVILVALCAMIVIKRYFVIQSKAKPMILLVLAFFAYTLIVYLFNFQSIFYFIWGARNTFRFYVAFFIIALFLSEDEAYNCLKILDVLFWVNFVAVVFQFMFLDVRQDTLGGIFGIASHSNGYTLIFLSIVISKSLINAFDGQESIVYCVTKCGASLLVAVMAEMKFYFFLFVILLIITAAITRFTKKKLALVIVSIIVVWVGAILLTCIFEEFDDFWSLEKLWESATKANYSTSNDVNRLSAIYVLSKGYVKNVTQQLFGMGLGNCDVSDISIFNSVFYQNHSYLHYNWFASAMMFLETGIVGLIIYVAFFALCFMGALKQIKHKTGNRLFCKLAIVMSMVSVILLVYNEALKIEAGYMIYFILALPFLDTKRIREY